MHSIPVRILNPKPQAQRNMKPQETTTNHIAPYRPFVAYPLPRDSTIPESRKIPQNIVGSLIRFKAFSLIKGYWSVRLWV